MLVLVFMVELVVQLIKQVMMQLQTQVVVVVVLQDLHNIMHQEAKVVEMVDLVW